MPEPNRQFHGSYIMNRRSWHQYLGLKFSSPTDFLHFDMLRMRKGTLMSRYSHLFLVSFVSRINHQPFKFPAGIEPQESGAIQFFLTQAAGIMIEDGIQAMYPSVYGLNRDGSGAPPHWARWLGYMWVIVFWVRPSGREQGPTRTRQCCSAL